MTDTKEKKSSLGQKVMAMLTDENAQSLAKDYSELAVDALIENEAIKSIPVVGTIVSLAKAGHSVHVALWEKKVLQFLSSADGASQNEWSEFAEKLIETEGGTDRAGEVLLHHLERLDDTEKARLSGMLYAAAATGKITIEELKRFCMILDRVYLPDLRDHAAYSSFEGNTHPGREQLVTLGILTFEIAQSGDRQPDVYVNSLPILGNPTRRYNLTPVGKKMLKYIGFLD